jgi:FixJ family two-component response regulator
MKTDDFVLIVEDDKDWGNIIKSLIKKHFELDCRLTKNYTNSVKLLKSATPLALILDLNLGSNKFNESAWGGWHLARTAKEKHIPFIIVTGHPRDDRIIRAFKDFGVADFFDKKDFDDRIPEFIQDIEKLVGRAKRRRARATEGGKKGNNAQSGNLTVRKHQKKSAQPVVFISYSHRDRKWVDRINTQLAVLVRNNQISVWDDSKIKPGSKWKEEINKALASAKAALLLISPDFLSSQFVSDIELPFLLRAAENKGLIILWVAIRPSLYESTYVAEFQSASDPSKPLANMTYTKAEQAIVQICQKIMEAVS